MERHGLIWSTGAKGRSPDNAAAEGFFGRMKTESVHPGHWEERPRGEVLALVGDCIPLSQGLSEYARDWGNNLIRNIGICGGAALTYAYAALVSSSVGGVKGLRFSALRNEFGRRLFLGFERRYP